MIILYILILILLLYNPNVVSICVISTCKTWLFKLVPILYPSFILIDFLSKDFTLELIGYYTFYIFKRIFNINYPKSSLILILSFICGAPASTKLIQSSLQNNDIDEKEADALIYATSCFSLPYTIFILNSFQINIFIYFCIHILYTIIILRICNNKIQIKKRKPKKKKTNKIQTLLSSTTKSIDVLTSILGIMILFNILLTLFNVNHTIYAYFEVLNGHNFLLTLDINTNLKNFILISSLNFLGLSIHFQILYVYPKLKYVKFFFNKLLYGLISGFIFFFIFWFF